MMKSIFQVIAVTAAFLAGIATHMLWQRGHQAEAVFEAPKASRSSVVERIASNRPDVGLRVRELRESPAGQDIEVLTLHPEVIDAILAGGTLERRFVRMGISEEQLEAVSKIQSEAMTALKDIEAANARAISDEKGQYVAIAAFPDERATWLLKVEADLRDLLGDDRAAIVSRMIAFADNDEDVGVYRRELFVTPPENGDQKIRIEERTFNEVGQHIDSDYELVDSRSEGRWGHLLDFDNSKE